MSEIAAFAPSGAAWHWMMSHAWRARSDELRGHADIGRGPAGFVRRHADIDRGPARFVRERRRA